MKRYWYSTFLAASLAAVIAVEYVPGAVRKLTPGMRRELWRGRRMRGLQRSLI